MRGSFTTVKEGALAEKHLNDPSMQRFYGRNLSSVVGLRCWSTWLARPR